MPSFLRPIDLERMRFNQLRSKNLVEAPWNIAQAGQQQLVAAPNPFMILPGAMGHNKWKTPPRGYDRGYGAAARSVGVLARNYALEAPMHLMQPVRFYTQEDAVRGYNRIPRQDLVLNNPMPISRGVLQRGDLDITNAAEIRSVIRQRRDPPSAYGVQENIPARMFPSTYVFNKYDRPRFLTPEPGNPVSGLRGVPVRGFDPYAPRVIAPMYGVGHQPMIIYSERTQNWRR
jgi:hypothetical protein